MENNSENQNEQPMSIDNVISINDDLMKDYINNYIDENDCIKMIENKRKLDSLNKYDDFKQLMESQDMNNQ